MNSIVTKRFIQCLDKLLEDHVVKSKRQFAKALNYLPQGISEIVNGRRDVTIELVRKAVDVFKVNADFLFTGIGPLFHGEKEDSFNVLTIVTDSNEKERIVHVPAPAHAGYVNQFHDPVFVEELPTYTLPDPIFNHGTYRSFDVAGDSMEPILFQGDQVICSFIESCYWKQAIKNGQIYVFVTNNDIVVKRAINQVREDLTFKLVSDNDAYKPYQLELNDIREIWKVRLKITSRLDLPESHRRVSSGLVDIEGKLDQQNEIIKSLLRKMGNQLPEMQNESAT
jgi:phage repressor protein C with HTH and peptisase S24 domain